MSGKIIDGKAVAAEIKKKLKEKIGNLKAKPKLAIVLVGHNEASEIYVKNKQKAALEVGIESVLYAFDEKATQQELEDLIEKLNKDCSVNGILIQLPLPKSFDVRTLLEKIDVQKDVDGFCPLNIGRFECGCRNTLVAATPKGVLRLLESAGVKLEGKNALVIGRSNIVGKPMAMLLLEKNCTVTIAHSATQNLPKLVRQADIVVSATGRAKMIKGAWLKKGAVVVDVGISRDETGKICGDVDFESALEVASYITPVPGGVGPMTIAMLLENVLEAYLKQNA
ncbi:MAG: bifunctional methylenetetrahydrofolate dehydrogenase/methenyltetrahydrofolate cyclohydrolase FolD [Alphaproteobacteria bacterium]|nr:bifunctional methylenetetrahydrofolate dehydrogenase/methenyltetrahydrofolate cyclohydrolase FolD [Alphaproteobacteria bacterium]